jgi:hypothetical protein
LHQGFQQILLNLEDQLFREHLGNLGYQLRQEILLILEDQFFLVIQFHRIFLLFLDILVVLFFLVDQLNRIFLENLEALLLLS